MKKRILIVTCSLMLNVAAMYHEKKACQSAAPLHQISLLDSTGKPSESLLKLLDLTLKEKIKDAPVSLALAVQATQKEWLRQPGSERWQMQEETRLNEKRDEILKTLESFGIFTEISPSKQHYDHCLVLGASVKNFRKRMAYLVKLWQDGIRFDHIVVLAGQRELDAELENTKALYDPNNIELPFAASWNHPKETPKTETDMANMVIDQAQLPSDLKKVITVIDTPMQKKPDGSLRRPNTGDTIAEWLGKKPKNGTCLCISHQPYVGYQHAVAQTYIPSSFSVESVGAKSSENNISVLLDNMARWLYQENIRLSKKN